jgi:hypothetical protein
VRVDSRGIAREDVDHVAVAVGVGAELEDEQLVLADEPGRAGSHVAVERPQLRVRRLDPRIALPGTEDVRAGAIGAGDEDLVAADGGFGAERGPLCAGDARLGVIDPVGKLPEERHRRRVVREFLGVGAQHERASTGEVDRSAFVVHVAAAVVAEHALHGAPFAGRGIALEQRAGPRAVRRAVENSARVDFDVVTGTAASAPDGSPERRLHPVAIASLEDVERIHRERGDAVLHRDAVEVDAVSAVVIREDLADRRPGAVHAADQPDGVVGLVVRVGVIGVIDAHRDHRVVPVHADGGREFGVVRGVGIRDARGFLDDERARGGERGERERGGHGEQGSGFHGDLRRGEACS